MKDLYYYSFYFLSIFSKALNKRNTDYAFSGVAFLTTFMGFNVFTIFFFFKKHRMIEINPYFLSIVIMLPLLAINYYCLISNNKSGKIIDEYKKRWHLRKKGDYTYLIILLVYIIASMSLCGYAVFLVKNDLM